MSSAKALPYVSAATYLEMDAASQEKQEYIDGEVIAMAGATIPHNRIVRNALSSLDVHLKNSSCEVFPSGLKVHVQTSAAYVYPDLSVICEEVQLLEGHKDIITNPSVIIEVLSEATSDYDHNKKFMLYRQIPSLKEYLMIASEALMLEHYVKNDMGNWVLTDYTQPDDVISISAIGYAVRLEEWYRGVRLGAS